MTPPGPFAPLKPARLGSTPEAIYLAIGKNLTSWEVAEEGFASLFNIFINPRQKSFPAQRAYGTIVTAKAREALIQGASDMFFARFPSVPLKERVKGALSDYKNAAARRNEIAHGIITGADAKHLKLGEFPGNFLGPSNYTSGKRDLALQPKYLYSAEMIDALTSEFGLLRMRAFALCDDLERHFQASPEKRRMRY